MLSTGESQLGTSAGALDAADDFSASLAGSGTGWIVAVVNVAAHGWELLEAPGSVFVLLRLGHGAVCEWFGVHGHCFVFGLVWLPGIEPSEWVKLWRLVQARQ